MARSNEPWVIDAEIRVPSARWASFFQWLLMLLGKLPWFTTMPIAMTAEAHDPEDKPPDPPGEDEPQPSPVTYDEFMRWFVQHSQFSDERLPADVETQSTGREPQNR